MVRTKADNTARKAVAAKAPRKVLTTNNAGGGGGGAAGAGIASPSGKYSGGNAACPRPTPEWQKGIGMFLTKKPTDNKENETTEDVAGKSTQDAGTCSDAAGGSSACDMDGINELPADDGDAASTEEMATEDQDTIKEPPQKNGLISDDDDDE